MGEEAEEAALPAGAEAELEPPQKAAE